MENDGRRILGKKKYLRKKKFGVNIPKVTQIHTQDDLRNTGSTDKSRLGRVTTYS